MSSKIILFYYSSEFGFAFCPRYHFQIVEQKFSGLGFKRWEDNVVVLVARISWTA